MRFLSIIVYILVYQFVHTNYLFKNFHYLGYESFPLDIENWCVALIFLLLPYLYSSKLKETQFELFYAIIYLLLYIPVIITYLNHYPDVFTFINNSIPIVLGVVIILRFVKVSKRNFSISSTISKNEINNSKRFGRSLFIGNLVLITYLVVTFRSSLSFVSFDNVYSHRENLVISTPLTGYLILWNTYLISPLSLITGLLNKNKALIFIGVLGSFIVYGINASKIVLFIPILIISFYYVKNKTTDFLKNISIIFSCCMLILLAISSKFFMLSAVILMRTFGISGLLTYQYFEFFKDNPYTYFSHINFVNFFTQMYPYGNLSLGMAVSRFFDEDSIANSNANFLATDGYSSLGGLGVIIVCVLFVWFLNFWTSSSKDMNLMTFMLIPFSFIILNVGLFTSIFSGGFLFLVIYNYLANNKKA